MIPDRENGRVDEASAAAKERRLAAVACVGQGRVALWEWCRSTHPDKDLSKVPPESWGLYTEDQNAAVEDAFSSGRPSTKLQIGIREYEIIFDGPSSAQQV